MSWALLAALSMLWGGSFFFYKVLATQLPPLTVVLGRVAVGAASLALLMRMQGQGVWIARPLWPRFLVLGLLNNVVPFSLFAWAEHRIGSGTAAILNATTPIFVLLVTAFVLRTERLTAARIAGIALGFAGVAVLVGPAALLGQDTLGQAACLLATFSYGFAVPFGRTIKGVAPAGLAFGQMAASTCVMLPLTALIDRPWVLAAPSMTGWMSLAGLGVLSTGLAYLLFFKILARAGATNLSLVTLLIPVSSLALGAALLGEAVTPQAVAGMGLIALGFAAIDGRAMAWARRRSGAAAG